MLVLDASALLAVLFRERGYERVVQHIPDACISTVNLAEAFTKFVRDGRSLPEVIGQVRRFSLEHVMFTAADAARAAELSTFAKGLSLGDRACLALARRAICPS